MRNRIKKGKRERDKKASVVPQTVPLTRALIKKILDEKDKEKIGTLSFLTVIPRETKVKKRYQCLDRTFYLDL